MSKKILRAKLQYIAEITTCDPKIYNRLSGKMEESISDKRVKTCHLCVVHVVLIYCPYFVSTL